MSLQIGKYQAEGPYTDTINLKRLSGVYVILGRSNQAASWNVLDVGESGDIRERIENHDRKDQWKRCGHNYLAVAPIYVNALQRTHVEQELRQQFNPPCGKR